MPRACATWRLALLAPCAALLLLLLLLSVSLAPPSALAAEAPAQRADAAAERARLERELREIEAQLARLTGVAAPAGSSQPPSPSPPSAATQSAPSDGAGAYQDAPARLPSDAATRRRAAVNPRAEDYRPQDAAGLGDAAEADAGPGALPPRPKRQPPPPPPPEPEPKASGRRSKATSPVIPQAPDRPPRAASERLSDADAAKLQRGVAEAMQKQRAAPSQKPARTAAATAAPAASREGEEDDDDDEGERDFESLDLGAVLLKASQLSEARRSFAKASPRKRRAGEGEGGEGQEPEGEEDEEEMDDEARAAFEANGGGSGSGEGEGEGEQDIAKLDSDFQKEATQICQTALQGALRVAEALHQEELSRPAEERRRAGRKTRARDEALEARRKKAATNLETCFALGPTVPQALLNLAAHMQLLLEHTRAAPMLEAAIAAAPGDARILNRSVTAFEAAGDARRAMELRDDLIRVSLGVDWRKLDRKAIADKGGAQTLRKGPLAELVTLKDLFVRHRRHKDAVAAYKLLMLLERSDDDDGDGDGGDSEETDARPPTLHGESDPAVEFAHFALASGRVLEGAELIYNLSRPLIHAALIRETQAASAAAAGGGGGFRAERVGQLHRQYAVVLLTRLLDSALSALGRSLLAQGETRETGVKDILRHCGVANLSQRAFASNRTVSRAFALQVFSACLRRQRVFERFFAIAQANASSPAAAEQQLAAALASANVFGWSPLHHVAALGDAQWVALLLSKGAKPAAKNKDGLTPLHVAATRGHAAVAEALLRAHPALFAERDHRGRSAADLACLQGWAAPHLHAAAAAALGAAHAEVSSLEAKIADGQCGAARRAPELEEGSGSGSGSSGGGGGGGEWWTASEARAAGDAFADEATQLWPPSGNLSGVQFVAEAEAARISPERFLADYAALDRPLLLRGATEAAEGKAWARVRETYQRSKLLGSSKFRSFRVLNSTVLSAEAVGVAGELATLEDALSYARSAALRQRAPSMWHRTVMLATPGNKLRAKRDSPFAEAYALVDALPEDTELPSRFTVFGGPARSGASLHFGGHAVHVLAYGTARWLLFPPPSAALSVAHPMLALRNAETLPPHVEVLQRGGDALYVPEQWGAMLVNLQESVGFTLELKLGAEAEPK